MNAKQRKTILDHLEHPGPGPVDAARMAGVPLADFEQEWKRGRREAEQGQTSDAASFYVMAQAAMSRCQSRLVADAHASSGTRESQDLLRVAEHLRDLAEPFADEEVGDVRSSSPILNLADRIGAEGDPAERERMRTAQATGEQGLYTLFTEVLRQEALARGSA